ncbi:AraC family transcriptional regulator [Phenylobacterium montanum]|uniref:Helix-turn-helix transcriptional regulator n=1 Tax=Phenylobacterium montanum TaxID=2823693 RepID=A0A975ITC8_9CAUL|nr:helix-turn-helix transcriptional regulator [Caulobacter sp. S6]QUD86339.1 helix-turn-helix transcriptional regulator [Caulobacter sp. S6]
MSGDGFDVRSLSLTFRDGARLDRHAHPWGQLVFGATGAIRVITDEAAWLAPPTRAVWVPPGAGHELIMVGETALRTLYIAPERAAALPPDLRVVGVAPLLREVILHILKIGMLDPGQPPHDRLAGLLIDLMREAPPLDLALPLPRDPRARTVAERLQAAPDDRSDLAGLAHTAGASLRTLQRLFRAETGLTLEAFRQKARLIAAAAALGAGTPVTSAALDCGYESPSAFIAAFKKQFGVTPGRFGAG